MVQPSRTGVREPRHDVLDGLHRVGDRRGDRVRQAHALVDVVDLATDHHGVRRCAAQRGKAGEYGGRVHRVGIQTDSRGERFVVGLENVDGARRAAAGQRVDEHQRLAAVEQVVGQVHAPDSVVRYPNVRAGDVLGDMAHHLGSEPVVAEEDVADAGYQYLGRNLTPVLLHSADLHVAPGIRKG